MDWGSLVERSVVNYIISSVSLPHGDQLNNSCSLQMLAASLLECHKKSTEAGQPLALRVFVSGRGRLENEGSTRLAEAFKVKRVEVHWNFRGI